MNLETVQILEMLRHLHNDIENVRRNLVVVEHKVTGLAYLIIANPLTISKELIEDVINPDTATFNLDELYSPIDEKDLIEWNEHLKEDRTDDHKNM